MNKYGYQITGIRQLRREFWVNHPEMRNRRRTGGQNEQDTDTRCAFVDYVDALFRSGTISTRLAADATL